MTNENTVFNVRTDTGVIDVRHGADPNGTLNTVPEFLSPMGILGPRIIRFNIRYRFGR